MNKNSELRIRILLTMQVALLGMITPTMRAVIVSWSEDDLNIRVIFDEQTGERDIEFTSEIETEVIAHIDDRSVKCFAEILPKCQTIDFKDHEVFVYKRARS